MKYIRILIIVAIIMVVMPMRAWGQQYNMTNGSISIDACQNPSGTIYDDGGASGNYSNSFDGWAVISAPQGVTITLTGNYNTEQGYDRIWIYDWDAHDSQAGTPASQSGNTLVNDVSGSGNINVSSSTGWLCIHFTTDYSVQREGFALSYSISGTGASCNNQITDLVVTPDGASGTTMTSGATVSWSATNTASSFIVTVNGMPQTVTTNSLTLTGLNPNTYYEISVVDNADAGSSCCEAHTGFRTPCGVMSAPVVEKFDDMDIIAHGDVGDPAASMPSCWARQMNYDDADERYPQIQNIQSVSSPASLFMFCGNNDVAGHWSLAIGPEISDDISSLFVRFHIRATNANARIEVGICDDTSLYDNNFTPVDTITVTEANVWQQKVSNHLSRYTGTGRHIAFRMIRSLQPGNSVSVYIDNLIIEPCGVWEISREERGINDFYVQWTNIGVPTVNIEIGPSGFVPGTGTMHNNVTSPYHFTGLEPGTAYQLRFYTTCNSITREQAGINVSTLPRDEQVLNICEDFESNGDNLPVGWRRPTTYDNTPRAYSNAAMKGLRGLYFRPSPYSGIQPIAVLPRIDTIDIDQLTLTFWLRSNYYNTGYVEVGVMEYPEYPSSFQAIDTFYATTNWAFKKVTLDRYNGNGKYIAFRAFEPYYDYNYLYIDNLQVGPCLLTGQHVTNIASHRVELRWDTVDQHFHGDSVTIVYGPAGFDEANGTLVRLPVNLYHYTINGLVADSTYEFIIYGDCEPMSQHCAFTRLSAHTLEADIALPYCQQFDGYATDGMPPGWNRPVMYDSRPRIWNSNNRSGDRSLQLRSYGYLTDNHSLVVMPMFDVDSVRGMTVSFYSYGTCDNYYNPRIQVGVMDNPNDESTFTAVAEVTPMYNSWTSHVVDLDNYTGTGLYIAFRYYHNNCSWCSDDVYIDDIIVSDAATSSESAYSVSSHGVQFKWLSNGRSYSGAVIEWGPEGFTPGSPQRWGADTVLSQAGTPAYHYALDTLQPGVTYNWFITALSSETSNSCNFTRGSFTTAAEPLQSSYCYGFDDLADESYPWNYSWYRPLMYGAEPRATTDAHSAPYAMYLRSYYNNNDPEYRSMAVMPLLEEDSLNGLTLRFWAKGSGSNSRFEVGMVSDPNDATTFTPLSTFTINHSDWRQYSVDLTQAFNHSSTQSFPHIAFLHYSLPTWESGWVYFDDITINRCNVSNVRIYSHTTTSFTVDWTTNGVVDSVEVEYGPQGFEPGTGTTFNFQLSTFNFNNLSPATAYDFYIRPYCSGSGSICSEAKFSTSTLATPVVAGYCEEFEGYNTYERPQHWTTLATYGDHPFIYNHSDNQYYTSPSAAFEFRSDASNSNLIVMPAAEEELSNLILSFNIRCSDQSFPDRPSLIVGAMSNPLDASTFVPIDTIHPTYSYRPVSIDLSTFNFQLSTFSYPHIAFRYLDDGNRYTYIDDLSLSHCRITNLHASQITDNSVQLSWTTLGDSDTTWIAYDTLGGDFSNPTIVGRADGTPQTISHSSIQTITNLLSDHTYTFRLWGECVRNDAPPCQTATITATTLLEPITIPFCEGFESYADGSIPRGWTKPVDVPNTSISTTHHDGERSLRLTTRGGAHPLNSFAVMPVIQMPTGTWALPAPNLDTLYFDAYLSSDYEPTRLTVGLMSDPNDTTTFTPIETFTTVPYAWKHIKCLLPMANSQQPTVSPCIAFRAAGGDDYMRYVYLDDINLRSCAINSVRASHPTETSVTLSWNGSGNNQGVVIEYKATGQYAGEFQPGTGTVITPDGTSGTTITPYGTYSATMTGLEEATYYTFHVYPVCDSVMDGCNYESVSMQTLHPWVDLPYCEDFQSINTALPNNWLNLSSSGYPQRNGTSSGHNETATNYATLYATSTDSTLFVLPRVYVGSQCPVLDNIYANFWTYFYGNVDQALLEIGVMTDANDPTTFVAHDTFQGNLQSPYTWQHNIKAIHNYNTETSYIAFRLRSLDGTYVYCHFDDLCLEKCVAADVAVSDVTQNSVTITWNDYGVDTLICEYGPAGYQLGTGRVVTITESPYVLTGLADGSEYEFTFATLCGCNQQGTAYTPGGGSWGGSGGWGGSGWGWYCCVPCYYDSTSLCRYWRWGPWHGHSWAWWYSQGGSTTDDWITPPVIDVITQAAMLETPYCESFEIADTLAFPPSWRRKSESHYPDISRTPVHSGSKSMRFYATPGNNCYTALPPLEMGVTSSMVMTFYAYCNNSHATTNDARFIVGVMNNPDQLSTFTPIDTIRLNATSKWQQQIVNFSSYTGEGQYIAFLFAPVGAAYNFIIDDLYLGPCAISGVSVVPNANTATVSWSSHNAPDHVLIQYGPQGETPDLPTGTWSLRTVYSSPYTVTISPDSSYDFYVSAICNDTATGSCLVEPITVNPSMLIPFCETFDQYESGLLPDRWKVVQRNSSRTQYPLTETQYSDHQILAFYPGTGSNSNTILLPPLPYGDSLAGKWVNVIMSSSSSSYIYLDLGYLSDTNNPSSFVQMATLNNSTSDQLQQFNTQLAGPPTSSGASPANRLAIRARSISGDRWIRLDRIVVSNNAMPMGISSTAYGVAQRTITWTSGMENCTLEYGYDGQNWQTAVAVGAPPSSGASSSSATLTNLLPDRDYQVYFISPSGERLCIPYTFHNESHIELPYCDDFSSYPDGNNPPTGWVRYHSRSGWIEPCINGGYDEVVFYGYSSDICQIAMPDLDIDSIRHADLRFRMYSNSYDYSALIIGVSTTRDGYSTFVPVDTVRNTVNYTWQDFHINLSRYQGSGRYITFRLLNTSSYRLYLDDLTITACPTPEFTISGATTVRMVVPYVPYGVTDYWIKYSPTQDASGYHDASTSIVHVTESPFYLTGLEPGTEYDFYALCDSAEVSCAAPVTLTTAERLSLPFCDNFDSYGDYSVPDNWYSYSSYGDSYPRTYYSCYYSCCKTLDFYCNRDNLQYIALPDFDIDSIRDLDLYFMLRIENSEQTRLVVGVMEDRANFSTFTPIDTLSCPNSGTYYPQQLSLAKYHGIGRFVAFRFLTNSNYRTSIFLDDLNIQSCPRPTLTLVGGTTVRMVVPDVPYGETDYWIEYSPTQDASGYHDTSASIVHVTESPFYITGLDENTTYDFYTRCDSAVATCFPPIQITTTSILPLPFCENFDDYASNTMPTGWFAYRMGGTPEPYVNGSHELFFGNYCVSSNRDYAIMPDLDIDSIRNVTLLFDLYSNYSSTERMVVGVMDSPDDISTFVPVDTVFCTSSSVWQQQQVSLANYHGNGRFIAFCGYRDGSCMYLYMDNLMVQACPRPTLSLVGGTTVSMVVPDVPYGETGSAHVPVGIDYWIEYVARGDAGAPDAGAPADSVGTIVHVTESPFYITGLDENTTYDFYTRCDSMVAPNVPYGVTDCFPPQTITTSEIKSIPYCEPFADYGYGNDAFPTGWKRFTSYNSNDYLHIVSDNDAVDNRPLRFHIYRDLYSYAVLPDFDIDSIKNLNISASMWSQSGTNPAEEFLEIGVMDNMDDISSFVVVDTMQNSDVGCWQEISASLSNYNGNGRFIAIRMRELSGNWRSIYFDHIEISDCNIPTGTTATLHGSRTVRINALEQSSTGFLVEYRPTGTPTSPSASIIHVDHLPFDLELDYSTSYDFYFRCDSINTTCRPKQTVTTAAAPSPIPYCEGFEGYSRNSYPPQWNKLFSDSYSSDIYVYDNSDIHSGSKSLRFKNYYNCRDYAVLPDFEIDSLNNLAVSFWLKTYDETSMTIGVMSDPNDYNTFLPVQSFTSDNAFGRKLVALNSLPGDARYLAFRSTAPNSCCTRYLYLDDIYIDTVGAADFRITSIESDEITFSWNQVGHPTMTIEYGPIGFTRGTGTIINISTYQHINNQFTISGLDPLTSYKFYFDAVSQPGASSYCNTNYCDSATVFTPAGGTGCIDPTNFTAAYTTCFYGTYGNPYANIGIVDYGSSDIRSRHAVNYDTTATDPRTGGLLRLIPEGADASVRLGNWNSNSSQAEAEAVTYSLLVDTTAFDLLVLKYAAVLQDPLHDPSDQPRFSLEVLDSNNTLLDAQCAAADFIANRNLGWNQASGGVLWKDWTTVGVDMSPYAGQTVRIRLTTRDCGEGNHYGYAYFTLGCMMKNMRSELCGDVDSNTFYAPAGFAYRWYSSANPSDTISTAQSLKVASDTITYYCQCSFVDNANCRFTISAFAGTRYPLALFDYNVEVRDCKFYVTFNNNSTISADGINPLGTGEGCESAFWDFGDGQGSSNYNVTHVYDAPGTYDVTLMSGIADNACNDTASQTITLAFPVTSYSLSGDSYICLGNSATLTMSGAYNFAWSDGDTLSTRTFTPDTTTLYTVSVVDSNGCADTLTHNVTVFPVSHNNVYETTIENNLPYNYLGNVYVGDTLDTIALTNFVGCDSIVYFQLHVYRNVSATADSTVCQSALPFTWNGQTFDGDSLIFHSQFSTFNCHGADSVLTMTLHVIPTTYADIYDTIVENQLPYTFMDSTFTDSTFNSQFSILNSNGCDSVIHYSLFVHRNVFDTIDSTVCQSALPFTWNGIIVAPDMVAPYVPYGETSGDTIFHFQFSTFNSHGADSVVTLRLTVHPVYDIYDTARVCENSLPYSWRDTLITPYGTYGATMHGDSSFFNFQLSTFSSHGCDSIMHLNLTVDSNTHSVVHEYIVENQLPYTFLDSTFTDSTLNSQFSILNSYGCDSIISFTLTVFSNVVTMVDSTVCQSALPFTWNGIEISPYGTYGTTMPDDTIFNYQFSTFNSAGADSVVMMTLHVIPTTYADIYDTIVENQLPYTFMDSTFTDSIHNSQFSILNSNGCDSIIHYSLYVHRNVFDTIDSTVCQSALPFTWNGIEISPYGTYGATMPDNTIFHFQFSTFNSVGADSVVTLRLTVHPVYDIYDTARICENSLPYSWRDTIITPLHNYTNTPIHRYTAEGCDSVMHLNLTVDTNTHAVIFDTIVENQLPYTFLDSTFTDSTFNSQFSILNSNGCDSVIHYSLFVHRNVFDTIDSTVCQSALPFTWNGIMVAPDMVAPYGTYGETSDDTIFHFQFSTFNSVGADSVVTLRLRVNPVYDIYDTARICENSLPYSWRDTIITPLHNYTNTPIHRYTAEGCDSIMHLNLTVDTNTHAVIFDTIVENQLPYTFLDSTFTDSILNFQFSILNSLGCDSIISYSLFVHRNVFDTIDSTVCQSALPFTWNGIEISPYGTYGTTMPDDTIFNYQFYTFNSVGADSVVTMRLHVIPTTYAYVYDTIVENQLPYTFMDSTFTDSTFNSQFSILNSNGCDSVIHYSLFVHRNVYDTIDSAVCESALPFTWNGIEISPYVPYGDENMPDDTIFHFQFSTFNSHGADSVVTLRLTVYPLYHWYDTATVCSNTLPYQWRDTVITPLQQYTNTQLHRYTIHGCDSLMSLNLTVAEPVDIYDSVVGCASTYYLAWRDTTININYTTHDAEATDRLMDYTLHRLTTQGCDSNLHLHLVTHPKYDIYDTVRICENSLPYTWRDTLISPDMVAPYVTYGESNFQLSTFNLHGCDSTMHLNLTVDSNTHAVIHEYIVENQLPYTFLDSTFTDSILNSQFSILNSHGCDSIISYSLTVYRNVATFVDSTICQSELPFSWNGIVVSPYGTSGATMSGDTTFNFQFSILNSHGADSVVTMTLHVNPTYHTDETLQICRDALPLSWHDTIIAPLHHYTITPLHRLTVAGCDSSFTLALTVHDTYDVIDSIESCTPYTWIDGTTYSTSITGPQVILPTIDGCDSVVTLAFLISAPTYTEITDSFCAGSSYHFAGNEITTGGIYYDTLQTIHHCDSIVVLYLTRLERPNVHIDYTPDCDYLTYNIYAQANVDHIHWSAWNAGDSPANEAIPWNPNWGPDNGYHLLFRHNKPVTLTLTADYYAEETCPASKSVTLNPIVQPLAQMEVTPDHLGYENNTVIAEDRSSGASWIQWWVDGSDYGFEPRIELSSDIWSDSVSLMLVALTENCTDTAFRIIPIIRNSIFAPNAFTPDEGTNRTFQLFLEGVIDYELTIYNRQGLLVYSCEAHGSALRPAEQTDPWDGTYKGKPCLQGNYVWILNYTTKERPRETQVKKGSVLLLR